VMDTNYRYSKQMLEWCQDEEIPLLYASSAAVYGDSQEFREERRCEKPLNLYAYSKFLFDQFVRQMVGARSAQVAGLRYFNVYGPNEEHKAGYGTNMTSVAYQAYLQFKAEGKVKLFVGSGGYGNGEQRRDFIHVDDAVAVTLFFLDHPGVSGLYNCGTGVARTWIDLAQALFAAMGVPPRIRFIDMPPAIRDKYQYHTQADMTKLRAAGYSAPFLQIEEGVRRYVQEYLQPQSAR